MKRFTTLAIATALYAMTAPAAPAAGHVPASRNAMSHRISDTQARQPRKFRPVLPMRNAGASERTTGLRTPIERPVRMTPASNALTGARAKAPARAEGTESALRLRGSIVTTGSFVRMPGLYYVPSAPGGEFEQIEGAPILVTLGSWDDGNGRYYVGGIEDYGIITFPLLTVYSTETWEEIDWPECDHSILCTDNATDPTTGDVYGYYYYFDEEGNQHMGWAKADYPAGKSDIIRRLDDISPVIGVACSKEGQYYVIQADGMLQKVDKATGEFTEIGSTGLRPSYNTSATYDDASGRIIFSYCPSTGTSSLWSIDPATAAASMMVEYEDYDCVTALEVIKPEADALAPAAPVITAEAPDGGMDMTYTITMPTTLFNGDAGSGPLHWTLSVDGTQVAEGDSQFGAEVTGSHTLASKGAHSLVASVTNEAGRSPLAKIQVINGIGTPKAPASLNVNNFGGGFIGLFWDEVTEAADGAYVDPAGVTYTVTRNGEVLAEGITDTWYDDNVAMPDTYVKLNYEVTASYGGNTSEPATASTGIGAITPPYRSHFSETDDNDSGLYTVENVNGDEATWWFSPYYSSYICDYGTEAADDWLISPAFHLEAGKSYELTFDISGNSRQYTERYALAMGQACVAAAMRTELVPPTEICSERTEPEHMKIIVKPETDGDYYFGWHSLSDAGMFQIHLRDIALSAPLVAGSPAEATGLALDRDAEGLLKVHGSFTAPAIDTDGNPLAKLARAVVTRDGKDAPVAEFVSPAPGAVLEFDDTDIPSMGTYTYRVMCYGAEDAPGRETSASLYVGPLKPKHVPEVNMKEDSTTPGTVKLSWEAPLEDEEGNVLNPANLTYMVYVANEYGVAEPLLDAPIPNRSVILKVCEPDEMDFALFYVSVFNLGLECEGLTRSPMLPVGKAETLPYMHSFTDADREAHLLGYVVPSGTYGTVSVGTPADRNIGAADGDDAFLVVSQSDIGATLDFFTGKIDLSGATNPALFLHHYKLSDADANYFVVRAVTESGEVVEIGSCDHHAAAGGHVGWNLLVCPLDKVAGKVVEISVTPTFLSHSDMYFDAISVASRHDIDMAALSVQVPGRIEPSKEFTLTANVANMGVKKVDSYKVEALLNGEVICSAAGEAIEPGHSEAFTFSHTLSPLAKGKQEFTARVVAANDGDAANDMSPVAVPVFVESKYPAVTDLHAADKEEGVVLGWSAPSTAGYDVAPVEDFENATAWTEEVDGWTMIDVDGRQIGTLEGAGLPEAVAMRTAHSFFVFDNESDDIFFYNPALQYVVNGNSGSKSLVAMYCIEQDASQDDWAISPLLSGEAQTISFYARSFHPDYLDHMEVLYSLSDSTNPADFTTLCPDGPVEVPQLVDAVGNGVYTRYEFSLPAGAKRFAIRACNEPGTGFMLMIDDVEFSQANATLEIDHYDVYRDGVCVNTTPVLGTDYTDSGLSAGTYTYNVVVAYNRGLSPASNEASVSTSGVGTLAASGISVRVDGHEIIVNGASSDDAVRLYTTDGKLLWSGMGDSRIAVSSGVYVLEVAGAPVKVLVK